MNLKRQRKYKWGTLTTERRSGHNGESYEVYVYRHFDNQVDENGHRKRFKTILGRTDEMTEDDALFALEHLRMSANTEVPQHVTITMHGLIERYIHEILEPCLLPLGGVQSVTARMSHGCASVYKWELKTWVAPRWGNYDVREFQKPAIRTEVEQWLPTITKSPTNPNGRAPSALPKVYNVMRQVFKWGVKWGYLDFNPLADDLVELPRGSTSQRHVKKAPQLTPAEFFLLIDNLDVLPKTAVAVDCWLSSRRSEAFGLKWKDLNLDDAIVKFQQGFVSGRVTLLKNDPSRAELPIPSDALKLLREWQKITLYKSPDDWVFASPYTKGKHPYDPQSMMAKHIRPVALRIGLPPISWHSFRHSAARWAKAALKKLEDAKEMLRQADIASTSNLYGSMPLEDKRAVQRRLVRYIKRRAKSEGCAQNVPSATTRKPPLRSRRNGGTSAVARKA
jgi:integrase